MVLPVVLPVVVEVNSQVTQMAKLEGPLAAAAVWQPVSAGA